MDGNLLYRRLTYAAAALALAVVVLGAYVRLSDAGLGCPDWPACYGHLTVGDAMAHMDQVDARYPGQPLQPGKAVKEMVHRYVAGTLGAVVLALVLLGWRQKRNQALLIMLTVLILFQSLLGMWTVTLKLQPLVVTGHLAGGMSVLALLWWLLLDARPVPRRETASHLRPYAVFGLLLLAVQSLLGGWTSSHYAGLACTGFPGCNGQWWPQVDYAAGFGRSWGIGEIDAAGLAAIQWIHRLGALVVMLYLGSLTWASREAAPKIALAVVLLLLLQIAIGIGNVVYGLPLSLAEAHNAGAALLLLAVVTLNYRFARASGAASMAEPS